MTTSQDAPAGIQWIRENLLVGASCKTHGFCSRARREEEKTRSVLGYVSIFDDEQRSHRTKDGVLREAQ